MALVIAPSRLHFGLLSLARTEGRSFGGAGLMIAEPGVAVRVQSANGWSSSGPLRERALAVGRQVATSLAVSGAFHIEVARSAPEHAGLGAGTQLALAVASAMAQALELSP